jgi:prepilin-type N-terminal cleavage/methylation domain-containing protein
MSQATLRTRRGFTLVEIMIVVVIIGVLLAIAVPNFVRARESSRAKSCVSNLKSINGAMEQWAMDNKKASGQPVVTTDLYGTDKYVKAEPVCPGGGEYIIEAVGIDPTCTVGDSGTPADATDDHVLP